MDRSRSAALAAGMFSGLIIVCACAREQNSVAASPDAQGGQMPPTAETDASAPAPASPAAPSPACPSGTKEVKGFHCATVTHLCLEGRDVIWSKPTKPGELMHVIGERPVHCPQGCATPYFCDKFKEGSATCGTKEVPDPADAAGKRKIKVVDGKELRFCIDEDEYPGVVGQLPRVMVSWKEAKSLCEARGERLCGDDEWTLACEGPEHLPYPYGWERDRTACNIDKPQREGGVNFGAFASGDPSVRQAEVDRLDQRVPIGSSPRCVSPYGVRDMAGNVDEWTVNVSHHGHPYVSLFKGGHWVGGARNRCRPDTDSHDPDFAFYAEGFRCCADPKK